MFDHRRVRIVRLYMAISFDKSYRKWCWYARLATQAHRTAICSPVHGARWKIFLFIRFSHTHTHIYIFYTLTGANTLMQCATLAGICVRETRCRTRIVTACVMLADLTTLSDVDDGVYNSDRSSAQTQYMGWLLSQSKTNNVASEHVPRW